MEGTYTGVALTIALPFGVLGLAGVVQRMGGSAELSRKLVHILLSNWILLAIAVYRSAWTACILPAVFIPLNYLSYRKGIFSAIERDEGNTPGTVWYAVSLFILCFVGYSFDMPWLAACGMLAMGYGDGLGALIGKKWGRRKFPGAYSQKSLEGMFTVMIFSALSVGAVCAIYAPDSAPDFALYAALSSAAPAAVLELFTPRGLDNLTLPLGVALIVFLIAKYTFLVPVMLCLGIECFILMIAYYLKAITLSGGCSAAILGILLFIFGGWISFIALIVFFVLGSGVSKIGKGNKADAEKLHERSGARSTVQVAANGLPSLIFAVIYYYSGMESCLLTAVMCLAAAAADTFSSEIGMLSKQTPRSILTLKPVQRGISGGFTFFGLLGGLLGAWIISILTIQRFGMSGMAAVTMGGLLSSVLDSVLGAAVQAKYQMQEDNGNILLTERKAVNGKALKLVRGVKWINNDMVNFASAFIVGSIFAFLWEWTLIK